jgi:hypothetical protein
VTDLHELRARQEALETANGTLHEAFRSVDGDAHTALEVARQNIKLITALRATQLEQGQVIAALATDVVELKGDVAGLKGDLADFKGEVREGLAEVLRRLPE